MNHCPCGSALPYPKCCGRYIDGSETPSTAEGLMRSRYTAYTMARIDYITDTHDPKTRDRHDPEEARGWAEGVEWQGLEILATDAGKPDDRKGTVDFVARFKNDDGEQEHRERSMFVKRDDRWYFSDGKPLGPATVRRDSPKVGRNDPCPCGSGMKFKKCHGR